MNRKDVLNSLDANVDDQNLIKHMIATEAIMRSLAKRLGESEDVWGLTGLLHDIDVELTADDPHSHGTLGADLASELGASEEMRHAILCHNEKLGIECHTQLDKALFCVDPLTGLITAAALVRPDKKLEGLTTESIMKRYKEKRFAAGANRDSIAKCDDINIELNDFVEIGLEAMKGISGELGL
jgi:putative nucleotidyltransferase with HDIG domain